MSQLVRKIMQPILTRIGSMIAAALVAVGMTEGDAQLVELAIGALVLFGIDLMAERWFKTESAKGRSDRSFTMSARTIFDTEKEDEK